MRKIIPLFGLMSFFIIFNVQFSSAELYKNQDYGFEIDFPKDWSMDDSLLTLEANPGYDDGSASFVIFYEDYLWNHSIEVGFIKNDFIVKNYDGQDHLDRLETELEEICITSTIELYGATCSDHKIIESKVITIDGHNGYQVTESWTETYADKSTFDAISTSIDIPIGDNAWTINSINLAEEYDLVKNEIKESIESFKFTNNGMAPELDYVDSGNLAADVMSFIQPISSHYVNSDVGLEMDFPENWQGFQMKMPRELFESMDTVEPYNQYSEELQSEMIDLLTSSTIVMSVPADMQMDEDRLNLTMIFIVELSAIENLFETTSQLMAMSSSPDSMYGGIPEESNDDCKIGSSEILKINNMKAYKIILDCTISETNQDVEAVMYMFGTKEHLIFPMHLKTSESGFAPDYSEFNKSIKTLMIKNPIDISDPQTYAELFDMIIDHKTIQNNNKVQDITIVSNIPITDFTYDEQNKELEITPSIVDQEKENSLGYTDIIFENFFEETPIASMNGQELDFLVTKDTTTNKTILSLSYLLSENPITISAENKSENTSDSIPDWVKTNAGWWADGTLDDDSFVTGIQFMIEEKIIAIPNTQSNLESVSNEIPSWVKTNAGWWADGTLDDDSFVTGIQFMISNGIIEIS